jgi:hypothetical protein
MVPATYGPSVPNTAEPGNSEVLQRLRQMRVQLDGLVVRVEDLDGRMDRMERSSVGIAESEAAHERRVKLPA